MVKVGCCGFPVRKELYYRTFPVIEVQQTFYQLPRMPTGERWRKEAPPEFEFTMKAWQFITHEPGSPTYRRLRRAIPAEKKKNYGFFKNTEEVWSAWSETAEFAKGLGVKKIIFQSPPSFDPSKAHVRNLRRFFEKIERYAFILIWEPRGKWEKNEAESICKDLAIVPCLDPFEEGPPGDLLYVRLHGEKGYRYSYTDAELKALVQIAQGPAQAYLMFNNVSMYEDAIRLKNFLSPSYPSSRIPREM